MAVVAGLAVVALMFIAFGRPDGQGARSASSPEPLPVVPSPAPPEPAVQAVPPPEAPLSALPAQAAAAEPSPGDSPAATQAAPPAPPAVASRAHSRHPGTASAESKGSGAQPALGEFKTTF
jgi:hypothetical protein